MATAGVVSCTGTQTHMVGDSSAVLAGDERGQQEAEAQEGTSGHDTRSITAGLRPAAARVGRSDAMEVVLKRSLRSSAPVSAAEIGSIGARDAAWPAGRGVAWKSARAPSSQSRTGR